MIKIEKRGKKMTIDKKRAGEWAKRLLVYVAGMLLIACGVTLSRSTDLGVSPVNSIPNVLSLRFPALSMGTWVILVFAFFILVQAAILLKGFKWHAVFQLVSSTLFGYLVDFTNWLGGMVLPASQGAAVKCAFIAVSTVVIALGIFMYLEANVMSMPGEGVTLALSKRTGLKVSTCKIVFDVSVVTVALALSFLFFGRLHGVGVGTAVIAVCVGFVMKPIARFLKAPLKRFLFVQKTETSDGGGVAACAAVVSSETAENVSEEE